jgi:putative N-acetylmannosamine-6-phosphate epimerase
MRIFKTKGQANEIDVTKLRGKIKVEIQEHRNEKGGEYYTLKAIFENGTTLIIDMQLIELLSTKLHGYIRKKDKRTNPGMDLMDELMEMVSGDVVRDAILESIYD